MAFEDPKAPLIRRSFATDVSPNERIEINVPPFQNIIAFYSGLATEVTPAVIEPGFDGTASTLAIRGQITDAGNSEPKTVYKSETLANGGTTSIDSQADHINLLADSILFTSKNGASNPGVWMPNGTVFQVINEIWHVVGSGGEPAFAGNWAVQGGLPVAFYLDATGQVHLRGRAMEPVVLSGTIFTLPVGYRPTQNMSWALKSNNDAASVSWIQVGTNGAVSILGNAAAARVQTILDGVTFPTF